MEFTFCISLHYCKHGDFQAYNMKFSLNMIEKVILQKY